MYIKSNCLFLTQSSFMDFSQLLNLFNSWRFDGILKIFNIDEEHPIVELNVIDGSLDITNNEKIIERIVYKTYGLVDKEPEIVLFVVYPNDKFLSVKKSPTKLLNSDNFVFFFTDIEKKVDQTSFKHAKFNFSKILSKSKI